MFRSSFLWKLYGGYTLLVLLSTVLIGVLVGSRIQQDSLAEIERALQVKATLLIDSCSDDLRGHGAPGFNERISRLGKATETRITIVDADGLVLADSEESPSAMENHGTRPEVLDARERGLGMATRYSSTLRKQMMYLALPVREGGDLLGFVRTSIPLTLVDERLSHVRQVVVIGAVVALAVGFVLGFFFTRRITSPLVSMASTARRIASGDYGSRVRLDTGDEVGALAGSFNAMADELERKLDTLTVDRNKLLAVLGGMVEGVIAVDSQERVLHMNSAAGLILGTRPEDGLGRPIWEICRITEVSEALADTMRQAREVRREVCLPEGVQDRVIELHASTLRDSTRAVTGAVVILHNITELRRLEQVRRDFVANVSHELKTPLTAVSGLIETILDDKAMDDETRQEFLIRIGGQVKRLSSLVKDLLTLSRIESQHGNLEVRPFDLRDAVEDSFAALSLGGRSKGITMDASLPGVPVTVAGDAEALREIVDNLLGNAIRYTPSGGKIDVSLSQIDRHAVLEIKDTGIGIEPRDQGRIFERFYRADKHRSTEAGGTGLGLSIVKNIAIAHGGDVSLSSVPGKGSAFSVRIPLVPKSV
jgi:two-component system phosphate regulon sensor histidine kinase PhoR